MERERVRSIRFTEKPLIDDFGNQVGFVRTPIDEPVTYTQPVIAPPHILRKQKGCG